jgi:hypothetical protein
MRGDRRSGLGQGCARQGGGKAWLALMLGVSLSAVACAPKQRVPIDVTPLSTAVYLDGQQLEAMPRELKLRSDRDHTLFFKSDGHRSELIVLRSDASEGKPRLDPAGVRLRLVPLDPTGRDLVIDSGDEGPASRGSNEP